MIGTNPSEYQDDNDPYLNEGTYLVEAIKLQENRNGNLFATLKVTGSPDGSQINMRINKYLTTPGMQAAFCKAIRHTGVVESYDQLIDRPFTLEVTKAGYYGINGKAQFKMRTDVEFGGLKGKPRPQAATPPASQMPEIDDDDIPF